MGWAPSAVRAASLADFLAAFDGWAESRGAKKRMSRAEARQLRSELWGDNGGS